MLKEQQAGILGRVMAGGATSWQLSPSIQGLQEGSQPGNYQRNVVLTRLYEHRVFERERLRYYQGSVVFDKTVTTTGDHSSWCNADEMSPGVYLCERETGRQSERERKKEHFMETQAVYTLTHF